MPCAPSRTRENVSTRSRIECNLSPGYTAFVARSLSVKLNSRRNFTRYTRDIPPPGACSPVVSLYSRPTKKEMPMGAASRRRRGWASFVSPFFSPPSLVSTCLHSASCFFMFRSDGRWNLLIPRSQFREGFVPLGSTFTVLWWPRQSSRPRHSATLGPVRTW